MLGRKCIPIPCTVYLFSGAAGLLGGRGGGVEGDGGGASRSSEAPRRMGRSFAVHTFFLFIYFIYLFFLVHTFTALLLICALTRQNCQLRRLTGG